jgi:hypothetical protein
MGDKRKATAHFGRAAWYNNNGSKGHAFGTEPWTLNQWETLNGPERAERAAVYTKEIKADPSAYAQAREEGWDHDRWDESDDEYDEFDEAPARPRELSPEKEESTKALEDRAVLLGIPLPHRLETPRGSGRYVRDLFDRIARWLQERGLSAEIEEWRGKKEAFHKDYHAQGRTYDEYLANYARREPARLALAEEKNLRAAADARKRRSEMRKLFEEQEKRQEELSLAQLREDIANAHGACAPSGSGSGGSGHSTKSKKSKKSKNPRHPSTPKQPVVDVIDLTGDQTGDVIDLTGDSAYDMPQAQQNLGPPKRKR